MIVHPEITYALAAHCLKKGVIIGGTSSSLGNLNNNICLSPALIVARTDIHKIVDAIGKGMAEVFR